MRRGPGILLILVLGGSNAFAEDPLADQPRTADATINVWPAKPPGDETLVLPEEADLTKPTDGLIAGRRLMRLGNVSTPTLAVYRPRKDATGAAIVICPGGAHRILAYDLEGTELAAWLNSIGVTGIVLKYRVPARDEQRRFLAAVQDAQRAMCVVRSRAAEWQIDPRRIGICGFSAGGETAARASLMTERLYPAVDDVDKTPSRPDFSVLVYPAYLAGKDEARLQDDLPVTKDAPPMFLVHAFDDSVSPVNSTLLFNALQKAGVRTELHLYDHGGHGYGLRRTEQPVTTWTDRLAEWMKSSGLLEGKR